MFNKYVVESDGNTYERVTAKVARKMFDKGNTIYLIPCKVRFDMKSHWFHPAKINKTMLDEFTSYEGFVQMFINYNCQYNELGKYPSYWIKISA